MMDLGTALILMVTVIFSVVGFALVYLSDWPKGNATANKLLSMMVGIGIFSAMIVAGALAGASVPGAESITGGVEDEGVEDDEQVIIRDDDATSLLSASIVDLEGEEIPEVDELAITASEPEEGEALEDEVGDGDENYKSGDSVELNTESGQWAYVTAIDSEYYNAYGEAETYEDDFDKETGEIELVKEGDMDISVTEESSTDVVTDSIDEEDKIVLDNTTSDVILSIDYGVQSSGTHIMNPVVSMERGENWSDINADLLTDASSEDEDVTITDVEGDETLSDTEVSTVNTDGNLTWGSTLTLELTLNNVDNSGELIALEFDDLANDSGIAGEEGVEDETVVIEVAEE